MTTVIEPRELVLTDLTVKTQTKVKPGEWVEIRKTDFRQRMRVVSNDEGKLVLVWP